MRKRLNQPSDTSSDRRESHWHASDMCGAVARHSDYLTADLDDIWHPAPLDALAAAEALMCDTIDLAERELGARFDQTRAELAEQRHAVEPPGSS